MTEITSPNPTSRRVVVIAVVAVAVLALTAASLFAGRSMAGDQASSDEGPVRAAFTKLAYTDEFNTSVAFAAIELRNTGDREAIIESVTPVGVPLGLDVLDIQAADTRELDEPIGAQTAHMVEDFRAAAGTTLPARAASSVQLVFVVAASRPGRFTFARTTVRYRVGEQAHSLDVPAGVTLAATAVPD
ncbi:MAG: hypothetical protein JHC84_15115 [Solirubrobacteraceae bacterium]|nr:hypothetical protein [Solirubrobacteraceae bacterium]